MRECIAAYSYIAYSHLLFMRIHRYSAHVINLIYFVRAQALIIEFSHYVIVNVWHGNGYNATLKVINFITLKFIFKILICIVYCNRYHKTS